MIYTDTDFETQVQWKFVVDSDLEQPGVLQKANTIPDEELPPPPPELTAEPEVEKSYNRGNHVAPPPGPPPQPPYQEQEELPPPVSCSVGTWSWLKTTLF